VSLLPVIVVAFLKLLRCDNTWWFFLVVVKVSVSPGLPLR